MIQHLGRRFNQKHIYLIWGVSLFLLITGTGWFFGGKTVFLLDYVPTPLYTRDRSFYLTNPIIRTLHDAGIYLFGHVWGSKIYLSSIFFLSIYLGYLRGNRIGKKFFKQASRNAQQRIILLSMLIFVCNPFFSARYGTQPGIWLSIVFIGWGIFHLVTHREDLQRKDILRIGIYRGVAVMSMAHASFMVFLLLATYLLFNLKNKKVRLGATTIGALVLLLNANRLLGGTTVDLVSAGDNFTEANRTEFATYAHSNLGPIATAALGYGFWGEKYGSAFVPTSVNTRRWLAGFVFFCFALRGYCSMASSGGKNKKITYWLGSILLLSLVLGVGISSHVFAPLTNRLYTHIPGYIGLREPQKRIGVYMMIMLPLMIVGRGKSSTYIQRFMPITRYALASCILLMAWTPGVFNAMKGRYLMVDYPSTYHQTRQQLLASTHTTSLQWLHLPRHSYHQCDRTNKIIANTFTRFFLPLEVITADNIEIGNLYTNSSSQRSKDIELFLETRDISLLKKHGLGGMLFTKTCADYKRYQWIETLSGTTLLLENKDIAVYTF